MRWLLTPALFLAIALFLFPVIIMFYQGLFDPEFTFHHFERFFYRGAYLRIFFTSIKISLIVGLLCVLIGYPVSYFIVRQKPSIRPLLLFAVLVPMWMSVLVRTYAWMVVLGREGILNSGMLQVGLISEPDADDVYQWRGLFNHGANSVAGGDHYQLRNNGRY